MKRNNPPKFRMSLEMFSSKAYFPVNKRLVQYYGPEVAVFLTNLIDKYIYFENKGLIEEEDWFFIIHKHQMEQTGLTISKIRTCKAVLKEDRILKTKYAGVPPKEWYKINHKHLFDLIFREDEITISNRNETSSLIVRFRDKTINNNKVTKEKIYKKINLPKKTKKDSYTERNKKYLPIAETLAKIILTKKNMKYTSIQISHWTNDIRQLVENNQVSIVRINTALSWYSKNIGGEYIPVIESGYSLKNKFTKLEDAMERKSFSSNKPPTKFEYGKTFYLDKDGEYYDRKGRLYM